MLLGPTGHVDQYLVLDIPAYKSTDMPEIHGFLVIDEIKPWHSKLWRQDILIGCDPSFGF